MTVEPEILFEPRGALGLIRFFLPAVAVKGGFEPEAEKPSQKRRGKPVGGARNDPDRPLSECEYVFQREEDGEHKVIGKQPGPSGIDNHTI